MTARRRFTLPSAARRGEMLRFGLTSALSAVITLGLPVLLHETLGVDPRIAVAIAFIVSFVVNFFTTQRFVFRTRGNSGAALRRFALSSLLFRGAEYVGFLALFHLGLPYYVAQVIVVGASFVAKFLTLRRFVFKTGDAVS